MRIILVLYLSIPLWASSQIADIDTINFYTSRAELKEFEEKTSIRAKEISDSLEAAGQRTYFIVGVAYEYPPNRKYYIKEYIDSVLVFEGLKYNTIDLGTTKEYFDNGNIKSIKHYSDDETKTVGLHGEPVGKWYFYNESGKLLRKEKYKDGRKVK